MSKIYALKSKNICSMLCSKAYLKKLEIKSKTLSVAVRALVVRETK